MNPRLQLLLARLRKAAPLILGLVFVASVASSVYFYTQLAALRQDPQKQAHEEMVKLVDAVGKLIVLPTDEDPTIATVADPEKLKDQAFFANAQVGDKVLLYTNAKKAILYNPTSNKIVEVAPINIGQNAAGTTTDTTAP